MQSTPLVRVCSRHESGGTPPAGEEASGILRDERVRLVLAAFTQLRLARRACVADRLLSWERRYDTGGSTPTRVHQVFSALLVKVGTPAKPAKPRGRSPGQPKEGASQAGQSATRPLRRAPYTKPR